MKERKYILLLFLLLLLLIHSIHQIFLWGVSLLFLVSLTICRLYYYFFLALSGGKMIVFLTQFIFIWTTLFSLLFFSRAFSLKKVVRNFSYPLDKLKILLSLSLKLTLGWNKFQYMTDQNNIEGNVAEGIERKRFWHKKILLTN